MAKKSKQKTIKAPISKKGKATSKKKNPKPQTKSKAKPKSAKPKMGLMPKGLVQPVALTQAMLADVVETMVPFVADPSIDNLQKIDHIVVLMMENRSFDHMMGYRKLNGKVVDGLDATMKNTHATVDYSVHHLNHTAFLSKQDPCHSGDCVAEQRSNQNGGFVSNWVRTYPSETDKGLVMGYYDQHDVPVYEMLANQYCLCEKWFSSVPGATWPNRLYSICGRCDGSKDNTSVPWYDLPAFVRHLDKRNILWHWYAHDFVSLRVIDSRYRLDPGGIFNPRYRNVEGTISKSFLKDAAAGNLPAVSWIDPNFNDFLGSGNDDHPPVDIKAGQELVLKIVNAIQKSPNWNKTMLVIVYDEHGGLFDHVVSPSVPDDNVSFRELGLRVPAFVISPWVDVETVSSTPFDHTSLIKTILLRFCADAAGNIPDMGTRVNAANHLGVLLTRSTPRPTADLSASISQIANWKAENFEFKFTAESNLRGAAHHPNELQEGIAKAKERLAELEAQHIIALQAQGIR